MTEALNSPYTPHPDMHIRRCSNSLSLFLASALTLLIMSGSVYGQPPTPPPPHESWNPPNEGVTGGQSHYEMDGWSTAERLTIWTTDAYGNQKQQFSLSEQIYLHVDTPIQWMDNYMWLYEYHQSNASAGRWRFWRREIGFGRFVFGPFYPDKFQPSGNYTWKVWILEPKSGVYQDQVISFTWGEAIPEFQKPALGLLFAFVSVFLVFSRMLVRSTFFKRDPST